MENSSQQSTSPVAGNSTRHPTFPDLGNSTQQSSSPEGPDLSSMTYADLVDLREDAVRKGDIPLRTEVNKELASEGRKAERKREYGRRYRAKNKEKLRKDYEDLQAKRHEEASRIFDEERERDRQRHLEMMARRAAKAAKV